MDAASSNDEAETIGLRALVWTLVEPERAMRFMSVTGLAPRDLRTRAGEPAVIAGALRFLEAHEPDLIECAAALDVAPAALAAARERLESA